MTKKEMIEYIGESKMMVDFSYWYLMKKDKAKIEYWYQLAQAYVAKNKGE